MSEQETPEQPSRFQVPVWVALAGGVLALLLAIIIIRNIGSPLADLLLGSGSDVPVPDGVELVEETDGGGRASKTWEYATSKTGCEIAKFYAEEGALYVYAPFACGSDGQREDLDSFTHIATCTKTEKDSVTGYSWDVLISSGYQDGAFTRFLVTLYE